MSTRKENAAQTELALKQAARRVFARQGYLATKITDIAAEAGRASGSFYNHFKSKEHLLEVLLLDWLKETGDELDDTRPTSVDLADRAVLRDRVVATYWNVYTAHRPEILALHQAALVDQRFAQRLTEIRHAQLQVMREHLEQLAATGVDLPGDPALVAFAINALLEQFCHVWIIEGSEPISRELEADEAIDTLADLLLGGIVGRPSPSGPRPQGPEPEPD